LNKSLLAIGDQLFRHAYPAYLPLYSAYKTISDRKERALMRALISPGMTIVDVGANIGIHARFLSRLTGNNGRVHAFEPSPANFSRLKENIAGRPNVTAVHAAVGEKSGMIGLFLSDALNVDHRTYDDGNGRKRIEVPLVGLDEYFRPGTTIDFLKIDVQGYEDSVLRGAARILQENPGIKGLIEFWPYGLRKAGTDPTGLLQFIVALGFHVEGLDKQSLNELDANREFDYCNILISRKI
jgi:FkbM family methyltransferase